MVNVCSLLTSWFLFYTAGGYSPVQVLAFAPQYQSYSKSSRPSYSIRTTTASFKKTTSFPLYAGGFEWEDPTDAFDQGVENPFKNPDLVQGDGGMKIDPARLLGPRLQGSNLYLIGMMGSGKSSVGDIVARSEFVIFYI